MNRRPVTRTDRGGFTLVEIMVVIGILTMVLAMGAPSFVRILKKEPLRQAASDVVEGLSHARAQAILQGVTTEFVLNAADGVMTVRLAPDRGLEATNSFTGLDLPDGSLPEAQSPASADSTMPPFSARLHPDIAVALLYVNLRDQMEAEEARVRFHPNGTSDDFTLLIESREGMRKVFLDSITSLADQEIIR
jgi:prepilin-type N-terminal cleavage/methylation domain-containing protein